ncbi:hypothetical protein [Desulfogranum japonicum]|uniref:hypothetical protein n=1 Tax=Desulfogranum japonicum TaxID=231447 RepID=UPI00041B222D|nr:hypothetical protein [Desulfogranum japonicum]
MDFKKHFDQSWQNFTAFLPSILIITAVFLCACAFSFGILGPFLAAGYVQSLLRAIRERRPPQMRDLLSEADLFLQLLVFGLLVMAAVFLGLFLFFLPGFIIILAVIYFCTYLLPLMTDRKLDLFDALSQSARMAMQKPVSEHVAVVVVLIVLSSLGGSVIFGTLFTTPFGVLFLLSVYEEKVIRLLPGNGSPPPPPGS